MTNNIIATPYLENHQDNDFINFLLQPFNINMVNKEIFDDLLFDGWKILEMGGWYQANSQIQKNISLEFYSTNYKLKNGTFYMLPFPETINDFICDCKRCDITLHWNKKVLSLFDIKHFLNEDDLKEYYNKLLTKIGK